MRYLAHNTSPMKYSLTAAKAYLGKRVLVSVRHLHADGSESFVGLWGTIESAQPEGMVIAVEGGVEESSWMIPPDLEALTPATQTRYALAGMPEISGVDYEAVYTIELGEDQHRSSKRIG
jgi:hypothetical protein